jgi:hypothetical protein
MTVRAVRAMRNLSARKQKKKDITAKAQCRQGKTKKDQIPALSGRGQGQLP